MDTIQFLAMTAPSVALLAFWYDNMVLRNKIKKLAQLNKTTESKLQLLHYVNKGV